MQRQATVSDDNLIISLLLHDVMRSETSILSSNCTAAGAVTDTAVHAYSGAIAIQKIPMFCDNGTKTAANHNRVTRHLVSRQPCFLISIIAAGFFNKVISLECTPSIDDEPVAYCYCSMPNPVHQYNTHRRKHNGSTQ
jgi:hypothetical protein